ncbi:MAG: glycosyltransferase family A protein [Flavobacteriaceae bacterium]|jgi:hypothetical protein|nr:glycosyltransferase family 2 protein [Flavobacteriaceae bacterium]MDG1384383.1 glycosyltransferase family A protein [Flavobacteriaceae bacterium]
MLSILIPTYNYNVEALVSELHIQSTACSIEFEIHIGDDFSCSDVIRNPHLSRMEFTYLHRSEKSIGRTAIRKLLCSKANYPWLLFVDADMLPKDKNYIDNYLAEISKDINESAYFGGYSYPENYDYKERLRYRYGIQREYKLAAKRNKNPYRNIYSGNMLVHKSVFILSNTALENRYGLDLAFSRSLETQKVTVKHLDNYTDHYGIEDNSTFLLKCKSAAKTLRQLYDSRFITANQSKLIKSYKLLEKLKLIGIINLIGWFLNPILSWLLINTKASFVVLDFYKMYHFSSKLKKNKCL